MTCPIFDERAVLAAQNNTLWCDAVCRAHGRPGEFLDGIWINRRETPRFYPNVVTFSEALEPSRHLECVRDLLATGIPGDWAVKDSFCSLELAPLGFRVMFEASWVYRAAALPPPDGGDPGTRWGKVHESSELADWERAWGGEPTGQPRIQPARVFPPALLEDKTVSILAAYQGQHIVAGVIANRTGDVVGISNVFVPERDAGPLWAGCVAAAMNAFPGLPLVGYEAGPALAQARELGFEPLRPLRVWAVARAPSS